MNLMKIGNLLGATKSFNKKNPNSTNKHKQELSFILEIRRRPLFMLKLFLLPNYQNQPTTNETIFISLPRQFLCNELVDIEDCPSKIPLAMRTVLV